MYVIRRFEVSNVYFGALQEQVDAHEAGRLEARRSGVSGPTGQIILRRFVAPGGLIVEDQEEVILSGSVGESELYRLLGEKEDERNRRVLAMRFAGVATVRREVGDGRVGIVLAYDEAVPMVHMRAYALQAEDIDRAVDSPVLLSSDGPHAA